MTAKTKQHVGPFPEVGAMIGMEEEGGGKKR